MRESVLLLRIGKVTFSVSTVSTFGTWQLVFARRNIRANLVLDGRRSSWTASSSPSCLLRVLPLEGSTSLTSGVAFSLVLSVLEMVFLAGPSCALVICNRVF